MQSAEQTPLRAFDSIPVAWLDRLVCASAGLSSLIVYLVCLPPSVTGEDSGELVAAAYTLGIPHPAGYPLWTLLAHVAAVVVPFGTVAWRVAAFSAFFGALTVWVLAELLLRLFDRRDVAWVSAMAFALSREFWQQSVVAEMYTLGVFLVLAALYRTIAWYDTRRRGHFYAAAVIAGLAGAHYTLNLLLLPVMFVFVFASDITPRRWRIYLVAALWTLPGWLIYVYLPVRAAMDPPMNWGDPSTPARFWDVFTRGQYAHLLSNAPRTWTHFGAQCLAFGRLIAYEFTPWVGVMALPGIAVMWMRDRALGVYIAVTFVVFAAGGILIPNFPLEYQWIWVNTPYWIPAYALMSFFLAASLVWLLRNYTWPRNVPAIGAVLMLASIAAWNGPHNYRRGDTLVLHYAADMLATFAPDAVYFGGGDHTVFPLLYLQVVEGRRPDVLIANRYGYPSAELYALAGEPPPATRPAEAEEDRLFARALELDRPVYSATPRAASARTKVYEGLLYRYVRAGETYDGGSEWPEYRWPARDAVRTLGDWTNELVAYEYFSARGRLLLAAGDPGRGAGFLRLAGSFVNQDKTAWNNIGIAFGEHGLLDDAAECFARALATDPDFAPALLNLARCRIESGDSPGALALLERAADAGADAAIVAEMKRAALGP